MSDVAPRYRLGVDIGGTFTDVLVFDDVSGALTSLKVPSNRQDPEQAILIGLDALHVGTVLGEKVSAISAGNSEETCPKGAKATAESGDVPVS